MALKKSYVVTFFKTVTDDYGVDREITQHVVEVRASGEDDAVSQAKAELCRLESLTDWSVHADRYEVTEPGFPSSDGRRIVCRY
jgi:hypothetical protein